jgi:putative ABC transport system substrate-binding protein
MRRRQFLTLLGGAAATWPRAARAQQPTMPVVGFLHFAPNSMEERRMNAFRQGLSENGYIEGQNVRFEHRVAEGRYERLPVLASGLVDRKVAVIVAVGSEQVPIAAKAATATIPIVFLMADDPVKLGIVESFARPGGNVTGVSFFAIALGPKRVGLLHDLVPAAKRIAVLVNPNDPLTESITKEYLEAAAAIGLDLHVFHATDSRGIATAFATIARERLEALVVGSSAVFTSRRVQVALLAARHAIPAIYTVREYVEAGGLMSYGNNLLDVSRQAGSYTGRILKGAKPSALPVTRPTKFELVINLAAASTIGIEIPPDVLTLADEVIE